MKSLLAALLLKASALTGLPMADNPPAVKFSTQCELNQEFGLDCNRDASRSLMVVAVYIPESNTVLLPQGFDTKSLYHRSVLLHELVHYLQDVNDTWQECTGKDEKQAYEAQFKYLRSQGVTDPMSYSGLNQRNYNLLISCDENPWRKRL